MKERHKAYAAQDARAALEWCGVPLGADFHANRLGPMVRRRDHDLRAMAAGKEPMKQLEPRARSPPATEK